MWVNVNPQVCRNYKPGNRKDISIKERMTLLQRKDRILYFKPHTTAKSFFFLPPLLIFTVRQAKIISHLFCLFLRHLSEMMAYFAALTLSTPRSKTAIIRFHQQPHTHKQLYTALPILAASHSLKLFSIVHWQLRWRHHSQRATCTGLKSFKWNYHTIHILDVRKQVLPHSYNQVMC